MSRWERWTTKPNEGLSLDKFLSEAPQMSQAQQEAENLGLQFSGFGWYTDPKSGRRVARIVGDKLIQYDQQGAMGTTAATVDTGNPTGPASGISPADRARQMGLQSDGSGGYVDPNTGEVAARTVNNELVFYSPQGGAVSDGAAGEQITQPSPSWVDPVTGELMMPPAQPESPEELAAVPDPVPALAPASYNGFMNAKRREMYKQNAAQSQAQADMDAQQMDLDEILNLHPGMRELDRQMRDIIDRADSSGDEKKMKLAGIARDIIENEAGDMLKYFAMAPDEQQDEILKHLKSQIITRAKMEEMEMRDGWENAARSLDDDEYEVYKEARRKRRVNGNFLDNNHDDNLKIPDAPRLEAGVDYPKEIEGESIVYKMKPYDIKLNPLSDDARKAARQAGLDMRNFRDAVVVEWEVKEDAETLDPLAKKKQSLEAVSLWKNEVLPTLKPGTVIVANPMETDKDRRMGRDRNQRERIYQKAGMGRMDYRDIMAGLVTDDGTVVPIRPTDEQKKKMRIESKYIDLINPNLNRDEIGLIYEMLFK